MASYQQNELLAAGCRAQKLCGLALVVLGTLNSGQVMGQNGPNRPLPTIANLVTALNQNQHKVSNLKVRWVAITATSPGLWSQDQGKDTRLLIAGKEVQVQRSLGLFLDGKAFVDEQALTLAPTFTLEDARRYWSDRARGIGYFSIDAAEIMGKSGQVELENRGVTTGYENGNLKVPFLGLGRMQIAATNQDESSLFDKGARVVGWQNFHGLDCIKLEYSASTTSQYSGYVLICPERDYKIVLTEQVTESLEPKAAFKRSSEHIAVEQFTKYGDAWIPTRVHHEWKRTMVDGQEKSLIEKFRVLEFQADAVNTDLLFEPLFSPGTRIYRNGFDNTSGKLEIVGGDVLSLVTKLQSGDFSILKENIEDLSKRGISSIP